MSIVVEALVPPIREDATGALRVGKSNVLLELVVRAFQDGATPPMIVQRYPTLTLADVYAIVALYLRNPTPIDEYLSERERLAEQVLARVASPAEELNTIREKIQAARKP